MTDHAATAMSYLEATVIDTYGDHDRKAAIAQVHATLALVEEQRTASLIAFYGLTGPEFDVEDLSYNALRADILARLGLTPTTPNQEQ